MTGTDIWIVDDILVRPGQGPAFLEVWQTDYLPAATERGMRLIHKMVEPAMWLDDEPNRLLIVWSVPHPGTVWSSKYVARMTPEVDRFWNETALNFIQSRSRSIMAEAEQLESLSNV